MTFSSVYEILTPITTVRKQKFWDWFDGNDLRAIWTKENIAGTGAFAMSDNVDEGFSITTGANDNDESVIHFNNIRHYAFDASECIFVTRLTTTTDNNQYTGLVNLADLSLSCCLLVSDISSSFYKLATQSDSTAGATASDISRDTSWHVHRLVLGASDDKLYIDGVLKVTRSTTLPESKLQPRHGILTSDPGAREGRIRYYEAYNT